MSEISWIITARPERSSLLVCLASIYHQQYKEPIDITVVPIYDEDWYTQANEAVGLSKGEWLVFPNDDCYYVPGFAAEMLRTANLYNSDIVYCDILYDPRLGGQYSLLNTFPQRCHIDKICYMIKRKVFDEVGGFPLQLSKEQVYFTDGIFMEQLKERGYRITKAKGILAVHN